MEWARCSKRGLQPSHDCVFFQQPKRPSFEKQESGQVMGGGRAVQDMEYSRECLLCLLLTRLFVFQHDIRDEHMDLGSVCAVQNALEGS
jgi:hypothetical protein